MSNVAIIILHFNGEKDTIECLKSIEQLSTNRYQLSVIVVDNGSKEKFKVQSSKFKVIRNEENLGFAGGNNVGIRYALDNKADYILTLNNDTLVDKNLINQLLEVAESESKIGIVAPKIYFAKGFEFHKDRYKELEKGKVLWYAGGIMDWNNVLGVHRGVDEVDVGQYESAYETDFASGCSMFVKREVVKQIGYLDDNYFLYYEEADFCERAKKRGYRIFYAPKAIVWHKNARSVGGVGSELQDYYTTRNRLLFGVKYAPYRAKIALIRESFGLLKSGRKWQKRGVMDFYLGRFGKGSYAK